MARQLMSAAAKNPHIQKAVKTAAMNTINNPQFRQRYTSARSAFQRTTATILGRNVPPGGAKTSSSNSGSGSGGSSSSASAFANAHAFWSKHKTAISSFIAANFMGIILLLQVGSGVWPLLKAMIFGHEQPKKKKIKDSTPADGAAASLQAQSDNDLGSTQLSDKEDGMTFYNVTNPQTLNTSSNPLNRQENKRPRRKPTQEAQQEPAVEPAVGEEVQYAHFAGADGNDAQHALPPPAHQSDQRGNADFGEAVVSATAEEIFAYSKSHSGSVATFDNSFHFKLGDNDGYQSSMYSEGVAGRDARESSDRGRRRSWFGGLFGKSDDPLNRARSTSTVTAEETLVFDMRAKNH